jgi:YVTN family beta-propeller protein
MSRAALGLTVLVLGLAALDSGDAAPRQGDLLIVLNKSDHDAALVEPRSGRVIGKLPTGRGPHEVAVAPDGVTAFVSNYGPYGIFRQGEPPRHEPGNTLSVLDLARRTVRDTFDLGEHRMPHGIQVSRDGSRLWVTCEGSGAVLEVDAASGAVIEAWKTTQEVSHMVAVTPDEAKLYVANIRSGSVTVITRASGEVRTLVTGAGAEGIAVSPGGREVWVGNRAGNDLAIVDVATDSIVARLESGGTMPIRVRFTPDGREVWVSNARSNNVTVFDAAARKLLAAIPVGAVPVGIEMSPDGRQAYVACTNDNQVKLIDVKRRRVTKSFTTGNEPDGMAWTRPAAR